MPAGRTRRRRTLRSSRRISILAGLLAFSVAACDRDDGAGAPSGPTTRESTPVVVDDGHAATDPAADADAIHSIAWHEGDVPAAFALAAEQDKPLFLYWGAEWCPPCSQIKATIFSKPEFVDKSRLFVPVYLDGDTARAQQLGDEFGVMGYPTMIVFDSAGDEMTRIPGGLDIRLYGEVLDLTLRDVRPVGDVLDAVIAGRPVSDDDYRLLAYYSWGQDNERALADRDRVAAYRAMATGCPATLVTESSRLYVAYVMSAIAAARDEESPRPLTQAQKAEALERISAILADEDLARANVYMVLYYAEDIVAGLTEADSEERTALLSRWEQRLDVFESDPAISTAHRLATAMTRIGFARLDDPEAPVPAELAANARAQVARADAAATTPYERQAVINTAWYVLSEAGLDDEATALLSAELEKSRQPYYFMLDLADLAEKAGREDEAIAWLERAYHESEGPATRFQWGYDYVIGLLEMAPEDGQRIEQATVQVLGELDDPENAIYNRTGRILGRLGDRLSEWNAAGEFDQNIAGIQTKALSICEQIPAAEGARATCDRFVAAACGEPGAVGGAGEGAEAGPGRC